MKLRTRQSVRHSRYGWGSILERHRDQTMVYFHTVGAKRAFHFSDGSAIVEHEVPEKKPVI